MSVSVTIGGSKTRVTQVALYKIEEETPDRLVLRAKKIAFYVGGAMLLLFGGILLFVAIGVVQDGVGVRIGLGAFGALLLAGGGALIRAGIRNKDRVIFERSAGAIRFDMTKEKDRHAIPFADVGRLELRERYESTASDERLLYQVFIVKKNGDERKLDEASNAAEMALLGLKAATLCGAPFVDRALNKQ